MVAEKNRVLSYYAFWQWTFWMSRLVQNENLFEEEPLTVYLIPAKLQFNWPSGFREDFGHSEIIVPGGKSFLYDLNGMKNSCRGLRPQYIISKS